MNSSSPWDEIAVPKSDLNVRQVAGKTSVPCFWGRDVNGACLFIVELQGNHAVLYRKSAIKVSGITIELRAVGHGLQRLFLILEKQVDRDIFEGLCHTLVSSLEHASDSTSSLAVSLAHVKRWKAFMAGRNHHLSVEEVRGLFAEINFLLELMDRRMSESDAVEAWLGPDRSHQDFIFGNAAVEIKSLSGIERNSVRISSEDQLETLNDFLFLRLYKLSISTDASTALSLNGIIDTVQSKLCDAETIDAFERKLATYGYTPLPDYDQPLFLVSGTSTYLVNNEFPRLVRSQLPVGLSRVSYDIKLETIEPFLCDDNLISRINNGAN